MSKAKAQYMKDLQAHPGWQILTEQLEAIKNELESLILTGQYASAIEGDILRMKRMNITFLLDMPNKIIGMSDDAAPEDRTDPYLTVDELAILKKHTPS